MGFDLIVLVLIHHILGNQILNTLNYLSVASDNRSEKFIPVTIKQVFTIDY